MRPIVQHTGWAMSLWNRPCTFFMHPVSTDRIEWLLVVLQYSKPKKIQNHLKTCLNNSSMKTNRNSSSFIHRCPMLVSFQWFHEDFESLLNNDKDQYAWQTKLCIEICTYNWFFVIAWLMLAHKCLIYNQKSSWNHWGTTPASVFDQFMS